MHFRNNSGFTLIEAMLAVTIIGIAVVPIFLLQGTILQEVGRRSDQLRRMFFTKQFLFEARQKQAEDTKEYSLQKKEERPTTFLTYKLTAVPKTSSLKDAYNLFFERVTATERERRVPEFTIVQFVFKPEREKQ